MVVEYKERVEGIEPRWYLVKWIGVNALPHKADSMFLFSLFRVQAHVDPYGTIWGILLILGHVLCFADTNDSVLLWF